MNKLNLKQEMCRFTFGLCVDTPFLSLFHVSRGAAGSPLHTELPAEEGKHHTVRLQGQVSVPVCFFV